MYSKYLTISQHSTYIHLSIKILLKLRQSIHLIKHLHFIYMNDMNNILMESGADFDCI